MQILRAFGSAGVVLAAMTMAGWAETPRPRDGSLKVGDPAPNFTVKDLKGQMTVKLSDLKGKPVVLVFGSCS